MLRHPRAALAATLALAASPAAASASTQQVDHAVGTAQVRAVNAAPGAVAAAPVTANPPVSVASPRSGGSAGGSNAEATASGGGSNAGAGGAQRIDHSVAAAQVGSVRVAPRAAAATPVTANGPVSVLSPRSGGDAGGSSAAARSQHAGHSGSAGGQGSAGGGQDVDDSIGAAQLESVRVRPTAAAAAPVTANAPVSVASPNSGGDTEGSNATARTPRDPAKWPADGDQEIDESIGAAQVGSVVVDPGLALAAPVTLNAPVSVLSPGSGGDAGGSDGGANLPPRADPTDPAPTNSSDPTDPAPTNSSDPASPTPDDPADDGTPQPSQPSRGAPDDGAGAGDRPAAGGRGPAGSGPAGGRGRGDGDGGGPAEQFVSASTPSAPAAWTLRTAGLRVTSLPFTGLGLVLLVLAGTTALGTGTFIRRATAG